MSGISAAPPVRWAIDLGRLFRVPVDLETWDGCVRRKAKLSDIEWGGAELCGAAVQLPIQLRFADDLIPLERIRTLDASAGPQARPRFRWTIDLGDLIERPVCFETREGFRRVGLELREVVFAPVRLFGRDVGVPKHLRFADGSEVPFSAIRTLGLPAVEAPASRPVPTGQIPPGVPTLGAEGPAGPDPEGSPGSGTTGPEAE